jgi:hypothetical protein
MTLRELDNPRHTPKPYAENRFRIKAIPYPTPVTTTQETECDSKQNTKTTPLFPPQKTDCVWILESSCQRRVDKRSIRID